MHSATILAYKDHGHPEVRVNRDPDKAQQVIDQLEEFTIHMDEVTHQLELEGVASFGKSFDSLMSVVDARREAVVQRERMRLRLARPLRQSIDETLAQLTEAKFGERLWKKDPTLWKPDDARHQAEIKIRMGWLDVIE